MTDLTYCVDRQWHLVCVPYSVPNLHRMAKSLGIKRCWFHASHGLCHYDVPKRIRQGVLDKSVLVARQDIVRIIRHPTLT